jgi:hypothetical protein
VLRNQIIVIRDEENKDKEISSTRVREYVNAKRYEDLKDSLSELIVNYHIKNGVVYGIGKGQNKSDDSVKIQDLVDVSKVEVIEYERLEMIRDWPVILGKGL